MDLKDKRLWIVAVIVVLVVLWLVWPSGEQPPAVAPTTPPATTQP